MLKPVFGDPAWLAYSEALGKLNKFKAKLKASNYMTKGQLAELTQLQNRLDYCKSQIKQ